MVNVTQSQRFIQRVAAIKFNTINVTIVLISLVRSFTVDEIWLHETSSIQLYTTILHNDCWKTLKEELTLLKDNILIHFQKRNV